MDLSTPIAHVKLSDMLHLSRIMIIEKQAAHSQKRKLSCGKSAMLLQKSSLRSLPLKLVQKDTLAAAAAKTQVIILKPPGNMLMYVPNITVYFVYLNRQNPNSCSHSVFS